MKKIHKAAIIAAIVALFLIILGISISEDYESPKERLYKAIRRDDLQTVKNVIEKYPELIDEYENSSLSARIFDTSSDTPLGEACKYMKVPIIQYLVESGADVNKLSSNVVTSYPLETVIREGYRISSSWKETIIYLVENGADYSSEYYNELIPFGIVGNIGKDDNTARMQEVRELLEYFVERGVTVPQSAEYVHTYGTTNVLGTAAACNQALACEYIIELGVYDIDAICGSEGETALICAARRNKGIAATKVLLDHGADKTIKDDNGKTAYDYAIENGNAELAELLKY